jgi:serine/threonine-protein kinase HipA
MDRYFLRQGKPRLAITPIDRLAYLGDEAMGALCYQPSLRSREELIEAVQIGTAAREALRLFEGKISDAGRLLARIGGSPGGARPKALIGIAGDTTHFVAGNGPLPDGFTHWLVKFSAPRRSETSEYGRHEGVLEYVCLQLAKVSGITVPEFQLIDDGTGVRHIAVRRFDRPAATTRRHIVTAGGLLHADHRLPSLDYAELLKVAWVLTRDSTQVLEQYRRAVFNLFVGNHDDHARNHGYLMAADGTWRLSPVYDVTFSGGPGGEHWTSYLGEGGHPGIPVLMRLAEQASLNAAEARAVIEQVQSAMTRFPSLAVELGIPLKLRNVVMQRLKE